MATPSWAQSRDGTEIIVTATPERRAALEEIEPERTVDEDGISSYGASSIGEVLDAIAAEVGDTGEPVLFVNGIPITDPGDIVDYPAEAVQRIEVLPRGAGARLGAPPDRRAYNVVLKRSFDSKIGVLGGRISTDGGWRAGSGELFVSRISGLRRFNLTLRALDENALFESERDLLQPLPLFPYDLSGNVIADPSTGQLEIDPMLSALAGRPVAVARVPSGASAPTLEDFARTADLGNHTDPGRFRTLRPAQRTYEASLTANRPVTSWLGAALTARIEQNTYDSLQGLRAGLFILAAESPFSPFSQSVAIARYFEDTPLEMRSRNLRGNVGLTLNATRGKWQTSLRGDYRYSEWTSRSQRQLQSALSPIVLDLDSGTNPFGPELGDLLSVYEDVSKSVNQETALHVSGTGPLIDLPAGPLRANLNAGWRSRAQDSRTDNPFFQSRRNLDRTEFSAQGSLEIPVTSREADVLGAVGDTSVTVDYGLTHIERLGSRRRQGITATWEPFRQLRLQGALNEQRSVPDPQQLGDAIIVTQGVRFFDVLRRETVDVVQIYGGNPDLVGERLRTKRLSATAQLVPEYSLQLNGEYLSTQVSDPISVLPPASAELMAAFPERFLRDSTGRLVTVDVRPLNFISRSSQQLRWGLNAVVTLSPSPPPNVPPTPGISRWRLQANVSHTINLADEVVARADFPTVDLLRGGAIGFGGGTTRHLVDFGVNLSDREVGVRLTGSWRSATTLRAGTVEVPSTLRFAPIFLASVRAYAEMSQLLPEVDWIKGTRLTLAVTNIANQRQRVTDDTGTTPLRYQPGYRDPLGRTLEIELRRKF